VLTTDFILTTTLTPQAQRDTDTPDLGWHYDCLDYCWTSLNLTNSATLLLTNAVAVGIYGTNGTTLWSGVRFASEGQAGNLMNRLVRYNTVQEQSVAWGATGSTFSLMNVSGTPATLPNLHLRFTDVVLLGGANTTRYLCNPHKLGATDITHSSLRGPYVWVSGTAGITVGLTNNLFHRAYPSFNQNIGTDFALYLRNNLFWHGNLDAWRYTNANVWAVHDNLFDTVTISGGNTSTNSYNGYYNTTALSGGGFNKTLTTVDYGIGPWGGYYYPTNGASGGLTNLINAGSRTADLAGLYHFTTSIGLAKETNSIVDISYHYVATDANGNPLDFDGDGIPDYLEDYNGNGVFDSGETDWKTYNSPNRLGANGLQVFTPLK